MDLPVVLVDGICNGQHGCRYSWNRSYGQLPGNSEVPGLGQLKMVFPPQRYVSTASIASPRPR